MKLFYPAPKKTKLTKKELIGYLKSANLPTEGLKAELWERCCENEIIPAAVKPDLDNVEKSILDALNKRAYRDDGQVVKLSSVKFRSNNPRAEVKIGEFKGC